MVDLSTYRCRIGRFHRRVRWIVDAGKRNFDIATIETTGAVCFIGLLLFCSGIELNPGPRSESDLEQVIRMQAERPPGQSFVMSKSSQRVQPRSNPQETELEINTALPPAPMFNGCHFPQETEQINNACQLTRNMPDVENSKMGKEKCDMTSNNRKNDEEQLPEDELTALYSPVCLRDTAYEHFQDEASSTVQDDSKDSRNALDAESKHIRNESEIQNIGSTKIYDKTQLKLLILHDVEPTKQDGEEIKQDYYEEIKRIKESESFETVFDSLLDKAAECKNNDAGQVMYEMLSDLKLNFDGECVCNVDENQRQCVWNEKEKKEKENLEKITRLQLQYYDNVPLVSPHSAVTYLPFPPSLCKELAAKKAKYHSKNAKHACKTIHVHRKSKQSGSKIKVGYISSDFRNHSMSHLISGLFLHHDRSEFEVFSYALNADDGSEFRKKIKEGSDHFRDMSGFDIEGRKRCIKDDGIDILINLNGYTRGADNELFSLELAPVQVTWLGFPGTSGSDYMHYIITDPTSTPLECVNDFSEKLAFMPSTHFVGDHLEMFAHLIEKIEIRLTSGDYCLYSIIINGRDLQPLRDAGQNSGFMIKGDKEHGEYVDIPYIFVLTSKRYLCYLFERFLPNIIKCFIWNHLRNKVLRMHEKLTIFGVDILNGLMIGKDKEHKNWSTGEKVPEPLIFTARSQYGLPDDKVVFANFNQNYKYDKAVADMWIQILRKVPNSVLWLLRFDRVAEVNFREYIRKSGTADGRIVFSDPVKKEEYIRRAQLADVFLDTPLCNAHTTCMDAIFAGLPVVTLPKRKLASRIAASIVKELGCEELIAKNEEDYVNIAVQLGNNPSNLKGMKNKVFTRRRESSLFDVQKKVKRLEELYKLMFRRRFKQPEHIIDLVTDELKAIPPRENVMQRDGTVQSAEDRLSLQESGRQEH